MKQHALALATIAALAVSPAAMAQTYVGVGAGPADIDLNCTGATSCDTRSNGAKLFGGFKFAPNWGAELNYFNFGKAKTTGPGAVSGTMKATGWGAGVAYVGEFAPQWLGVGRLGVARTKSDLSGTVGSFTAADSKSSTNPYIGLGVGYAVLPNLSVDLALDFSRVKYASEKANVRLLSVGVTFGF